MHIEKFDPLTDFNEVKRMLETKAEIWQLFQSSIEKNKEYADVARYDDKIVGFLLLNRFNSRRVDITVYVDDKYRRKGFGTKLLRYAERFIENSAYEHAYCQFNADDGAASFLTANGYRLYYGTFYMERGNTLIDSGKLSDEALLKRGIVIRNYRDEDYMGWHNTSDIAFYLLRKKLGLTPPFYQQPSGPFRRLFATECQDRYVMAVHGVISAIGIIKDDEINLLAVRPDLQKRGYGRIMASYLNNVIIKERHAEKVKISVIDGNPAKKLYEALGFRIVRYAYEFIKYYKPESRPGAPKGYIGIDDIVNDLRLYGALKDEQNPS